MSPSALTTTWLRGCDPRLPVLDETVGDVEGAGWFFGGQGI